MKSYLIDLVLRMEADYEGEDNPHEEARNLSKISYVQDLFDLIADEPDKSKRRNLYFILGCLTERLQHLGSITFLIDKLKHEKDRPALVNILNALAKVYKPLNIAIGPIFNCVEHKNWHVRCSAFGALTNSAYPVEDFLIDRLRYTIKFDEYTYLLTALRYIGTEKSLPVIKPFLKNRNSSVNNSAHYSTAVIMLREGMDLEKIHKYTKLSYELLTDLKERLPLLTRKG
jgi:hypothetical protein